jgi:hypothetical protein
MIETKITTALLFAVAVEAAGVLMWTGSASERLRKVEAEAEAQSMLSERLARVEVHQQMAVAQLDRIEKKLEAN